MNCCQADTRLKMPIKVRCEGCQTVLNVSDQAAGKAVKCKQCGGRVLVPSGDSPAATRPRPKAKVASENPDDLFSGLDLDRAEDAKRKVCPGCARPVRDDDVECPKCGVTIATGSLSDKQRRRVERRGPPPEEFYSTVWPNGWKFLKKHWQFGVQTALVWTVCLTMSMTSLFALNYYVTNRVKSLHDMVKAGGANIEIKDGSVRVTVPKEGGSNVVYDGTYYTAKGTTITLPIPEIQARKEPPSLFWMGMTLVFQLGFGGWAWTLATTIAGVTMAGEKKVKRFTLDFFGNLTMGFRFYVWPTVLTLPLLVIPMVIVPFNLQAGAIIATSMMIVPLLVLPAAVVHMSQKYSYRAWLLTWMARDFWKTIAPSMYIFAMNLLLVLLVPISVAIAGAGFFVGTLFGLLFNFYGWSIADQLALGVSIVATLGLWGFYFSAGESGSARATLGKWSIGLIVLRDDNKPQTRQQAFARAASAFVTSLTLYIGFIMCFFRADKKAMHDLMSKSKVVWQGEQT